MPNKIDAEVKERCVRQVLDHLLEYPSVTAAAVVGVATHRSSLVRVFAGGNGRKSDDTDALSIAMVGLRPDDLPVVRPDDWATTLRLLAHRRRAGLDPHPAVCRLKRELLILLSDGTKRGLTAACDHGLIRSGKRCALDVSDPGAPIASPEPDKSHSARPPSRSARDVPERARAQ